MNNMLKPKYDVLIEVDFKYHFLTLWADNIDIEELKNIKGISFVYDAGDKDRCEISVDHRYSKYDIANYLEAKYKKLGKDVMIDIKGA